jgi:hypothetical protein
MLILQNINDPRWILATIVESGNHQFWGWHELFLFFLRTWNQNFCFCLRAGKFSSAAPTIEGANGTTMVVLFVGIVVFGSTVLFVLFLP